MESREAKMARRMKNEASDCSGDWLQLVVMIGAGRGGKLHMCALKEGSRAHDHASPARLTAEKMLSPVLLSDKKGTDAALANGVLRACVLICVLLT